MKDEEGPQTSLSPISDVLWLDSECHSVLHFLSYFAPMTLESVLRPSFLLHQQNSIIDDYLPIELFSTFSIFLY